MSRFSSDSYEYQPKEGIAAGFQTYWNNVKFILRHPFMLLPFVLALMASSYLVSYISGQYDIETLSTVQLAGLVFLFVAITTVLISMTALFILELLEQHETTGQMRPGLALKDMFTKDLWRALPFIMVWAVIDFVLLILITAIELSVDAKDSRWKKRRARRQKSALKLFQTTVRMGTMTIFSIIAWEDRSIRESFQKGRRVFKEQILVLIGGSALSRVTTMILAIPLILMILIVNYTTFDPTIMYYIATIYLVISWSFSRLVEQLFVSDYYLWYYKYEQAIEEAKRYHKEPPTSIRDIERPSFFDQVQSLEKAIPYED